MLENAVYSVITVEGCAAILWKDGKSPEMREKAATALRITAPDLFELRVIDEIIPEPPGGAHAEPRGDGAGAAGDADPPPRGAAEAQAGQAGPPAPREVPAHGAVPNRASSARCSRCGNASIAAVVVASHDPRHRGIRTGIASDRSRLQGQPQGVLPLGRRDPPPLKAAVIVDADRGEDLGHVHALGELAREAQRRLRARLRQRRADAERALRLATDATSVKRATSCATQNEDARRKAMERVKANSLVMKLTDAEWQWDRRKLTFYFTAEKRVDFREPRARSRVAVPHAHRAQADRRARRGQAPRRHRPLRPRSTARRRGCPSCARSTSASRRTSGCRSTRRRSPARAGG